MAKRQPRMAGAVSAEIASPVAVSEDASELPAGWAMATVGEILRVSPEKVEPSDNPDARYVGLEHIETGTRRVLGAGKAGDVRSTKSVFRPGDILYGKLRPYLNKVARPDFGGVCSTDILVLQPSAASDASFAGRLLGTQRFIEFAMANSAGINLPRASFSKLADFSLALPPVPEQRRIVERLEVLEVRSRRARAALDALPPLLAQARQSIFAASVRGDLTADWRKKHGRSTTGAELLAKLQETHRESRANSRANAAQATEGAHDLSADLLPDSWVVAALQDVCCPKKPICYGILMPGPNREEGVPYVRVADFPNDYIRLETIRKTSAEMDAKFSRSKLRGGDLLLSIRGTVGRVAVVPTELNGANITQDSARLSIHELVCPPFVEAMLRAPDTQQRMQRAVKGVAVRGINIGDVRPLQIPLPPLAEQREIVRRLEAAFARLDATVAAHAEAVAELDRLDAALLAKAFRGELVAQDPADEPAAVTLKRLRTPREEFDPFAYLFQFIPALLRASDGVLPFVRVLEGCALLRVPRDLVRLLEPIGGAAARQHFERFAQPLKDGSFEPVLHKLIAAGAITHDPRAGHRLRLVEAKAPPIEPLIAEDARHVASVLALVPTEALEAVAPAQTRKLCTKSPAAVFATA